MTAAQLMLPANRAFDSNGFPEAGATVKLYQSGTTTPANFYADAALTIVLGSTLTANAAGRIVIPAYQDRLTPFRLKVFDAAGDELDDIDPFYFGSTYTTLVSTASTNVATRTAMAAIVGVAGAVVNLTESGREGKFVFDSTNFVTKFGSPLTTIDPAQGIYVAPSSDTTGASGAWVRSFFGPVNPEWFGVVRGASGVGATNSAAFQAMLVCLKARTVVNAVYYRALEEVRFPSCDDYNFAGDDDIDAGVIIRGAGTAYASFGTQLIFPAGKSGLRLQYLDTSGVTTANGGTGFTSSFSQLHNLRLAGGFTTTEGEFHGVVIRSHGVILNNVWTNNFQGDGIFVYANAVSHLGNANNCQIIGGGARSCRNGLFVDGADANILCITGFDASNNRQWGIWDSSFLGNTYTGCHSSGNGIAPSNDGVTIGASVTSNGTNRYFAIAGQEPWASLNPPSGTTADNQGWAYASAGGSQSGIPLWTSGMLVRAGGSYQTDNVNAANEFFGCYAEGGQGQAQLTYPTQVFGGFLAKGVWRLSTAAVYDSNNAGAWLRTALQVQSYTGTDETVTVQVGERVSTLKTLLKVTGTTTAPNSWRFLVSGNDLYWNYQNSNALSPFLISGPNTALTFGTGAAVPHSFVSNALRVGATNNARLLNTASAAPASGTYAKGDTLFNFNAAATGPFAFQCTTAGTPGTWTSLYAMTGAPTTGWVADTGTAKRTSNSTYTKGATLTYSATYVQAEQTAMATRMAAVEQALQDAMQTIKALKDDLLAAKAGISV